MNLDVLYPGRFPRKFGIRDVLNLDVLWVYRIGQVVFVLFLCVDPLLDCHVHKVHLCTRFTLIPYLKHPLRHGTTETENTTLFCCRMNWLLPRAPFPPGRRGGGGGDGAQSHDGEEAWSCINHYAFNNVKHGTTVHVWREKKTPTFLRQGYQYVL